MPHALVSRWKRESAAAMCPPAVNAKLLSVFSSILSRFYPVSGSWSPLNSGWFLWKRVGGRWFPGGKEFMPTALTVSACLSVDVDVDAGKG